MTISDEHLAEYQGGKEEGRGAGLLRAAEICEEAAQTASELDDYGGPFEAVALRKVACQMRAEAGNG